MRKILASEIEDDDDEQLQDTAIHLENFVKNLIKQESEDKELPVLSVTEQGVSLVGYSVREIKLLKPIVDEFLQVIRPNKKGIGF